MALSFDFDGQTSWLYRGERSPASMSRGEYGARVGIHRIPVEIDEEPEVGEGPELVGEKSSPGPAEIPGQQPTRPSGTEGQTLRFRPSETAHMYWSIDFTKTWF